MVKSWITLNPVAPTNTTGVNYNSHVAELGWLVNVANGGTSGTTGQNRRMEAIKLISMILNLQVQFNTERMLKTKDG